MKNQRKRHLFTIEEAMEMNDNLEGGCLACGAIREGCEPDARNYECDVCGEREVYGAEELMLMGFVQ